jgi:uncharacterized membrane protein YdjX (TVP38/TMEM64 family)
MSKLRRVFLLQLIGLAVGIGVFVWLTREFDLIHVIIRMQKKVGQTEKWGGAVYPFLYAGCNLLLLPGGLLTIGSGLCFGLWWGFFLNLVGNLFGAAAAFGISRLLGRQWVERKIFHNKKWRVLDEAITREGWKIIFLSQVHPLFPTSLLNYLYGITRIRFWPCMAWIALGQTPGLFFYSYLGTLAQLGIKLFEKKTHPHPIEYVVWIGGLLLTFAVTFFLGKTALRLMAEIERATKASDDGGAEKPASAKGPTF